MAWSDAARAAALEVRRAHASQTQRDAARHIFLSHSQNPQSALKDKSYRIQLAKHLKAFRAGGKARRASEKLGYTLHNPVFGHTIIADAIASTQLRNMAKQYSKKRRR